MTRRLAAGAMLAAAAAVVACADPIAEAPAQYIAVRRAWAPGERQALIQRIMANHEYVFLYVGDISSMAPQLYADTDSVTVLIANPAHSASLTAPMPATSFLLASPMFNASWNFVALKVTTVNKNVIPADTVFWHLAVWSDPLAPRNHGFAIAFSRANTFNITPINTTTFEAAFGKAGAAAGEFHATTGTLWEDLGGGGSCQGQCGAGAYQVTSQIYPGAFSAITTGPYLGGQSRTGQAFGRVSQSGFTAVSGNELPTNFTVDFDYRVAGLPATEILCVFPSPCTTNVPAAAAAARRGPLPDSLRAQLPWSLRR